MTPWLSTHPPTHRADPPALARISGLFTGLFTGLFARPFAHPFARLQTGLRTSLLTASLALAGALLPTVADASTPADLQAGYTAQAGSPASAIRGQQFFNARQGREWSCASCHGAVPTQAGQHAATGKAISALAPAFNPARFTDPAKVEKWFRRNCFDVAARECSAAEKADVMAWLLTLKP